MEEPSQIALESRPTILIGYGAFGLDALQRLLAGAALRGALAWEEPEGGASPSERRLRDLALLWLPDAMGLAEQQVREGDTSEGSSLEVMRDLYRQIRTVDVAPFQEVRLAEALEEAAGQLLSATSRAARDAEPLPLGLDVVVLARPTHKQVFGTLDRLLEPGMGRLAGNANLVHTVVGAEPLSFVEILDFDHYWSPSPEARRLREATWESVRHWQDEAAARRPAFRRIYLVDGRTRDGIRDAQHRLDEISLFLELMLFEGQRGELQRLYQPASTKESPVASFGVRMMERGTGLLSRLAAARFGMDWLAYLAGEDDRASDGPRPPELVRGLARYQPEALDALLAEEELRNRLDEILDGLEGELLGVPPELDDWPRRLRDRCEERLDALRTELSERAGRRMAELSRTHLAELAEEIQEAVDADLHHPETPSSLTAVIRELDRVLDRLDEGLGPPPEPVELATAHRGWTGLHQRYRHFRDESIYPERLKSWWPLFAIALTVGLTPLTLDLLEDALAFFAPADPVTSPWLWVQVHGWLSRLVHPVALGSLLLVGTLSLGRLGLHRPMAVRTEQAALFFLHPQRGRFADQVRTAVGPGGQVRALAEQFIAGLLRDMTLSIRGEVRRELRLLAGRLRQRHREIGWLRGQLREFLKVHGVDADRQSSTGGRERSRSTGIRQTVERPGDLERVLAADPPTEPRFRSAQCSEQPFRGWQETYSDAFLYPLLFIERISGRYRDPFQQELASPGIGPEQEAWANEFLAFVRRWGSFDLAFSFNAREGLPPAESLCLLPPLWRRLPGVLPILADHRIGNEQVLDGPDVARSYLLHLRTGIRPDCLVTEP